MQTAGSEVWVRMFHEFVFVECSSLLGWSLLLSCPAATALHVLLAKHSFCHSSRALRVALVRAKPL